jgi:hypothetical protein
MSAVAAVIVVAARRHLVSTSWLCKRRRPAGGEEEGGICGGISREQSTSGSLTTRPQLVALLPLPPTATGHRPPLVDLARAREGDDPKSVSVRRLAWSSVCRSLLLYCTEGV